jgi:hypothetical protein
LVLAAAVAAGGLVACSGDSPDLPQVGDATLSASADTSDTVAQAKAFHDCLSDAGLEVGYQNDTNGAPTIVIFTGAAKVLGIDPDGIPYTSQAVSESEFQDYLAQLPDDSDQVADLRVDGQDYTDVWVSCHQSSGYSTMNAINGILNSPFGTDMFQKLVLASNDWAACARENGFPEVQDAHLPQARDLTQVPTALLPASITEAQLRALLETCPNFDAARMKANDLLALQMNQSDQLDQLPEGFYLPPSIGFDYPGFNGEGGDISGASVAPGDQTAQRLTGLLDVLNEALMDYYSQYGLPGLAQPS